MNGISAISRSPHQHPLPQFFALASNEGGKGVHHEAVGNEKTTTFPFPSFTLYYCHFSLFFTNEKTVGAKTRDNWGILGREETQNVSHVKHRIAGFSKFYQVICDGQSSLKNIGRITEQSSGLSS